MSTEIPNTLNIRAIVAMNENNIIGINGKLPWNVPPDLERFRDMTLGNIVVMGRKTQQSLPSQRLPRRLNIVLTRSPEKYISDETLIYTDYEHVMGILEDWRRRTDKKIFVIGGEDIFNLFSEHIKTIYLTIIYKHIDTTPPGLQISRFPLNYDYIKQKYNCVHLSSLFECLVGNCYYRFYTYMKKRVK